MFRNKKLAAEVYASQSEEKPVLAVSTSMDIGEHPAAYRGRVMAFTNASSVRMYRSGRFIREFTPADSPFDHLPPPPLEIDDFLGDEIREKEHFAPVQARYTTDLINYASRFGYAHLTPSLMLKTGWLMLRYGMRFSDAYALYGKYTNNWGDSAAEYRFDGIKDGAVIASVTKAPVSAIHLAAEASSCTLHEGDTYDASLIRITMRDQNDNVLPFYQDAVKLQIEGPIRLIGPDHAMLRGGMGGTFIRSIGQEGNASLTLSAAGCKALTLNFSIRADTVKAAEQGGI